METLRQALSTLTVDALKNYLKLFLPDEKRGSKKADVIELIETGLQGKKLQAQFQQLDKWQQLAVAETLYAPDKLFHLDEFSAKYGTSPTLSHKSKDSRGYSSYYDDPARIRLFLYRSDKYTNTLTIPDDLSIRLKEFVAEPAPASLPSLVELPKRADDEDVLTVRPMEQEAVLDLHLMLNLVEQGKVQVSEKTGRGSGATVKLLAATLNNGDYYPQTPKQSKWDQEIGPMKAFAWPLLLQAAKLVQLNGKKLGLNKAGIALLSKPPADTLRLIWQRWLKNTLLDEFKRIDEIKGQNAKGRVMTAAAPRRVVINDALSQCPVNQWVEIDQLFDFMQASKRHFEVTHNSWKLYILDAEYGSLGYDGFDAWSILQGRYLLCLLFEYAATLGIVDVAYTAPELARDDYAGHWGVDEMNYLSRYDGLRYFRLTALGAYCLNLSDSYQPSIPTSRCSIMVLPGLQINIASGLPSPEELLILETWASKETDKCWRLDKAKSIRAIEKGHHIDILRTFLQNDEQTLPETVEGFLSHCQKNGIALKPAGTAVLIDCASEEIAKTLAEHKETAKLCQRLGKKQLLVKLNHEDKFRQAIRVVGFGMLL